jgi:hypothetical protein
LLATTLSSLSLSELSLPSLSLSFVIVVGWWSYLTMTTIVWYQQRQWRQSYNENDDVSYDDNDCTVSMRTAINNVRPSYEDDNGNRQQRTQQLTYRMVQWQGRQSDDDDNQQWLYRTMPGRIHTLAWNGSYHLSLSQRAFVCLAAEGSLANNVSERTCELVQ